MAPAIHIELDALCLILLSTIAMQSRRSVNQQKDRILFRTTAYGIIILLVLDILWVRVEGRLFPGAIAANLVINALYLGGGVVIGCLWYLYVLETLGYRITRRLHAVVMLPGREYEIVKDKHGFVVGGLEDETYENYELQLQPGSKLFLYTDGLPEAKGPGSGTNMFGMDRLLRTLNADPDAAPQQTLSNMNHAVADFVQNEEQFDDLTMLCLEYKGDQTEETT